MMLVKGRQFFRLMSLLEQNESLYKLHINYLLYFEKGLEAILYEESMDVMFKYLQDKIH